MQRSPCYVAGIGLLAIALSGSDCPDDGTIGLAPTIAVDACTEAGNTANCSLDFGVVAISTRVTKEIKISNVSPITLKLSEPTFTADSDPAFRVEHWPDMVGSGLESRLVVSFRPLVVNNTRARLLIHSDAANMAGHKPVEIEIVGSGVDNGLPQIEVVAHEPCRGSFPGAADPANMGIVAVGYPAACTFEVFNRGTKDLVVERVFFAPDETDAGFEFVGRVPGIDPATGERFESTVPPPADGNTSSRSFVARGIPSTLEVYHGVILVETNDPGCAAVPNADGSCPAGASRTHVRIPVLVEGAESPTAKAGILSINGSTDFDVRAIEPLDDVVLTADGSRASSGSLTVASYHWEIISQPTGSHGSLDDPSSQTPRFVFNSSGATRNGIDIAGFWAVRLTVIDSRGVASINDAVVTINAIPNEAIHLQMVWDNPVSDVDLHLVRENPDTTFERFSENDCYYANCKIYTNEEPPLEWFPGEPQSNPSLDVDDVNGYGPENINIKAPKPGKYQVGVHYFSDHDGGPSVCVLRIFLYGNLHSEYIMELVNGSTDYWNVATIDWPSRDVEVTNAIEVARE